MAWFLVDRSLGAAVRSTQAACFFGMAILQTVVASLVAIPLATGLNWVRGGERTKGASLRRAAAVCLWLATLSLVWTVARVVGGVGGKRWWFLSP